MKFEYKTIVHINDPSNTDNGGVWREEINFMPCCDEAREHHGSWTEHDKNLFLDSHDASINIGLEPDDYFGGWQSQLEIKHCPFCGAKIVAEEVERVNVTVVEVPHTKTITETEQIRTEEVVFRKGS